MSGSVPTRPEIADEMRRHHLTTSEMAKRMRTSRAMLHRVLDHEKESPLSSIAPAARAVGKCWTSLWSDVLCPRPIETCPSWSK